MSGATQPLRYRIGVAGRFAVDQIFFVFHSSLLDCEPVSGPFTVPDEAPKVLRS